MPDSATTSELGDPQDVVWRNQSSRQRGEWVVAGLRNEIVRRAAVAAQTSKDLLLANLESELPKCVNFVAPTSD